MSKRMRPGPSRIGRVLMVLAAIPGASAQTPTSGVAGHVGAAYGTARSEAPAPPGGAQESIQPWSFTVFGGLRWPQGWGMEFGWSLHGDVPVGDGLNTWNLTTQDLTATGWLPLRGPVALFAQAGLTRWEATRGAEGGGLGLTTHLTRRSGLAACLGGGLQVDLGASWALRAQATWSSKALDAPLTRLSAGAAYRF